MTARNFLVYFGHADDIMEYAKKASYMDKFLQDTQIGYSDDIKNKRISIVFSLERMYNHMKETTWGLKYVMGYLENELKEMSIATLDREGNIIDQNVYKLKDVAKIKRKQCYCFLDGTEIMKVEWNYL